MSIGEIWLRAGQLYDQHGLKGQALALREALKAKRDDDALANDWLAVAARIKIFATLH